MIKFITNSMLNMFQRCPEQFRRRFLEGEIIPPGISARIGTSLHRAAEENHRYKLMKGEDLPKDYLQDLARDTYKTLIENEGVYLAPEELTEAQKLIAEGLDTAVTLTGLYRDRIAPEIKPYLIEKEIFIQVDDLPVPFRGTLDLITEDHLIIDFKTTSQKWSQEKADGLLQPTFYWFMAKAEGISPNKFVFKILIKKSHPEVQTLETTRTEEDLWALIQRARVLIQAIEKGVFPPTNPENWWCSPRFCGYYATCPYIPPYKKTRLLARGY